MSQISWTHDELVDNFGEAVDLNALIKRIEVFVSKKDEFITQVAVNGMNLTETDESKFSLTPFTDIQTLTIVTSTLRHMLLEAIKSSVALCEPLQRLCIDTADQLRSEKLYEAHRSFEMLVNEIENLVDACQLVEEVTKTKGYQRSDARILFYKKFNALMIEVLASYEKRDFILTADQLEYELTQVLTELSAHLQEVGPFAGSFAEKEESSVDR
jgi:hypothetical protein